MDELDKKIDESIKSMSNQIKEDKLSDEFKENLCKKLEENEKAKSKSIPRININIYKTLIATFACLFIIIAGYSLADDFENIILKKFSNIDEIAKKAIEDGNVEYIDMDYVTDQGISIKADYLIREKDSLYVALEVKTEEDYDEMILDEISILDEDGNVLFGSVSKNIKGSVTQFPDYMNNIIYVKINNSELIENGNRIFIKEVIFIRSENSIINGQWIIRYR